MSVCVNMQCQFGTNRGSLWDPREIRTTAITTGLVVDNGQGGIMPVSREWGMVSKGQTKVNS